MTGVATPGEALVEIHLPNKAVYNVVVLMPTVGSGTTYVMDVVR
jgi:hypothetical protein